MKFFFHRIACTHFSQTYRWIMSAGIFFITFYIAYVCLYPTLHQWKIVSDKNTLLLQKKSHSAWQHKTTLVRFPNQWHLLIHQAIGQIQHNISDTSEHSALVTLQGSYPDIVASLHRIACLPFTIDAQYIYMRARTDGTVDLWMPMRVLGPTVITQPLQTPLILWNPFVKNIDGDTNKNKILSEPIEQWKWIGTLTLGNKSVVWFMTTMDIVFSVHQGQWIGSPPEQIIDIQPHQLLLKRPQHKARVVHLDVEGAMVRVS